MNSKLEALISAYQVKPKKLKRRLPRNVQKVQFSNKLESSKTTSIKSSVVSLTKKKRIDRENHSVQPHRSESNSSLSRYLNSSLDEDMEKLDNLTVKNSSARLDWIMVKQKIIELSVNKKLNSIEEMDESGADYVVFQQKNSLKTFDALKKYETRDKLNYKDRIKSLDNLMIAGRS